MDWSIGHIGYIYILYHGHTFSLPFEPAKPASVITYGTRGNFLIHPDLCASDTTDELLIAHHMVSILTVLVLVSLTLSG